MKTSFIFFLGFAAHCESISQGLGEIHGRLVNDRGEPIEMAHVRASSPLNDHKTVTDSDGRFKVKPLLSGTYALSITVMGYRGRELQGVNVDADIIKNLGKLVMQTNTYLIAGEAVVEVYEDKLIEYDGTTMYTLRADEIRQSPAARDVRGLVSTMSSDIFLDPSDGELSFRGSRGGNVVYFLDGVKMTESPVVPSSGLSSVQVYSGGVPAKYGDCTGGYVVMETKNYAELFNKHKANVSRAKTAQLASDDPEAD